MLFYQALPYGSQALFNPLTVVFNKGYDVVQLWSDRDIWDFPYGTGFKSFLPDVLLHPVAAVERDPGWSRWLRTEILPLSVFEGRWTVNWSMHFLGGGVTHRSLIDWYSWRGFPLPKVLAGSTTMAASILNEILEHPGVERGTSSSVADLWFFDLAGVLFFSWDPGVRWVARHLHLADWSNMASFAFPGGVLENNGQFFVLRPPSPWESKRFFIRFGLGAQAGLSHALDDGWSFTAAFGVDTNSRTVHDETHRETIDVMPGGGLFLDRNNSLMASLTMSASTNRFTLNLYPGLADGLARDLGLWVAVRKSGSVRFGLVHRRTLGLGLGFAPR